MKGPEVEDSSSAPDPEPDSTVELVDFRPSLHAEGPSPASVVDAAAQAKRRRFRRILIGSLILLVILGVSVGPSLYREAKTLRAASLARSAVRESENGKTDAAIATVRSAYMMAPDDPQVVRAMAKILSTLNAPSAMTYWNWILASHFVTMDDRREAAECALKLGLYNQAGMIIKDLFQQDDKSAPNLLMAARYYALAGAASQAISFGTRATEADPDYKPAAIFLAVQELGNPYLRQAGVDALLKIAQGNDAFSFLAIERLAQESNLKPEENQALLTQLQSRPRTAEMQKIVELVLQLKLHPDQHDNLIKQAVGDHANATPGDLSEFGAWLNSAGESKWTLALITRDKALTNKDLFLVYLDAMGEQQKWTEMTALLTQHQLPLETPYVELYLYRCAREMGDSEATDLHWRSAQVAASHSPRQSLYLASYAEKLGDNDRAEAVFQALTKDAMAGRPAYLGLISIYRSKDTRKTRDLLDAMASRWPQDEAVINDDIYYNLLLNTRVREMCARAVALAKADVYSTPHLTDVALAYLLLHDPVHALEVFKYGNVQWDSAPPSARVVCAAVLKANGQEDQATRMLSPVNRNTLRPEEEALIKNIR